MLGLEECQRSAAAGDQLLKRAEVAFIELGTAVLLRSSQGHHSQVTQSFERLAKSRGIVVNEIGVWRYLCPEVIGDLVKDFLRIQ